MQFEVVSKFRINLNKSELIHVGRVDFFFFFFFFYRLLEVWKISMTLHLSLVVR